MKAFVIIPYKEPYETIYRNVISPAVRRASMECAIAKEELFIGPITDLIHQMVAESSICIADVSELNPNVMYEVGIAITLRKPVIFLTHSTLENIPFDIQHHNVLIYRNESDGLEELHHKLVKLLTKKDDYNKPPTALIEQMLVPTSLVDKDGLYVVAASPLSFREASRSRGGWKERPLGTYSDHIGIRGLMQSFGSIFSIHRLPELLDPDDFVDEALAIPCHLYCIASPKANRLTGWVMKKFFEKRNPKWEFRPDPDSSDLRNPRLSIHVNGQTYDRFDPTGRGRLVWDFGLVIRGPHPIDPNYMFLVMAGRTARGTEASCLAVTDPDCLGKLQIRLKEEGLNPDNHKHAFCAVVSIGSLNNDPSLGPDKSSFKIEDLMQYC